MNADTILCPSSLFFPLTNEDNRFRSARLVMFRDEGERPPLAGLLCSVLPTMVSFSQRKPRLSPRSRRTPCQPQQDQEPPPPVALGLAAAKDPTLKEHVEINKSIGIYPADRQLCIKVRWDVEHGWVGEASSSLE